MWELISSKPVLIGLHLGFAIIGIDAFLWLLGKYKDKRGTQKYRASTAGIGVLSFIVSWIIGGYYYVVYYGTQVKPIINSGSASWAHGIIMEAKEHIFLFIVPLAIVTMCTMLLTDEDIDRLGLRRTVLWLIGLVAGIGLTIGLMGFIISSAARWSGVN